MTNTATTTNTIKYFARQGYAAEVANDRLILTRVHDEQHDLLVTTLSGVIYLELRFPMTAAGEIAQAAVIAAFKN